MNFLKDFFSSLQSSLYDIHWLKLQKTQRKKAWRYFFVLMVVMLVFLNIHWLWTIPRQANDLFQEVKGDLPHFVMELKGGELYITELDQPYIWEEEDQSGDKFTIYVDTVNTSTPTALEIFEGGGEGLMITRDQITASQKDGVEMRSYQMRDFDEAGPISSDQILSWTENFVGRTLPLLVPVFLFLVFLFGSSGKLFYLLIVSLIVWSVGKLSKTPLKYGEVFTIGLFAVTLPTLVVKLLGMWGHHIPYLYTIILAGLLIAAIFVGNKTEYKVGEKEE
jgi:hypothetical protein